MSTDSKPTSSSGAFHPDLVGGSEALRYRPQRLDTGDLESGLTCQFLLDKARLGPFAVLDLSPTGLAIDPGRDCVLVPGSLVDKLEVSYAGDRVWEGSAQAVYQIDAPVSRTGLRFTSGLFDLESLRLSDSVVENQLSLVLEQHRRFQAKLPNSWRARVSTVRQLLESVKELVEGAEAQLSEDSIRRVQEEDALFDRVFSRWGPVYHEVLETLHDESRAFEGSTRELAHAYATRELLPLVSYCPMHRRAYEKPLGYAGDYRMMLLMLQKGYKGKVIFSRFLHHVSKNYSFGRMVPSREAAIRRFAREAVEEERPLRILSFACGPAVELQNLVRELEPLKAPIELILVDQSEETMKYCHEALSREILKRGRHLSNHIELNCLHLSVRQVLQPKGAEERKFISDNLDEMDLIYSAGLYDYLPRSIATRLARKLYKYLRPGGRLLIGNLSECPDTTWMMEHVLAWHLEYRTPCSMEALGTGLNPAPSTLRVESDETGLCLFLNVVKPATSAAREQ